MQHQWLQWICLIVLLSTSCTTEIRVQAYPKILTLPVETISFNEFVFNATIIQEGTQAITELGFYWDGFPIDNIEDANQVEAQLTENGSGFSGKITYALTAGHEFYVRAYCRTAEHLIISEEQRFIGRGGNQPIITNISPEIATRGENLIIQGTGFSSRFEQNEVYLNDILAGQISYRVEEIVIVVPEEIMSDTAELRLISDGAPTLDSRRLAIAKPVIDQISPNPAPKGARIEIIGEGFSKIMANNQVWLDNESLSIISSTKEKIVAQLPALLGNDSYVIRVSSNGREVTAIDPLSILP